MSKLLDNISNSTKKVVENACYVKINYDVLDKVIEDGRFNKTKYWLEDNNLGLLDLSSKDIINFLLIYHTIGDYCFWGDPKWTIYDDKQNKLDGSIAMMYLVLKRYKEKKSFVMSFASFKEWLKGNVEIPLLKERYNCLLEMNKYLERINNDFYYEINKYLDDSSLLEYIVNNLSYYNDECMYDKKKVYFYKRAQLLVSDILHVRKLIEKKDVVYKNLIGCADYKIPQVMRSLGILEYNQELLSLVDNKIPLEYGSKMEVEIRASDLVVLDYIANKLDNKVARMDVNDYIWLLGQDKNMKMKPYHRTLTIYY